ncbi:hypothetical protein [Streptomyces sp. NPDC093568]|uniref:hypothetical protein n=1 Tax=Streptomyces sp. NPDC093568 TaxID=3366041 RepID=UPI00380627F1
MANTTALPKLLRLTDRSLREQPEALPASAALIGISTNGRAIAVDIDAAQNILVCSGTGGGSTTILRTLTAQFLHQAPTPWSSTPPWSPTCGRGTCRRSRTAATSPASTKPWSASPPS